MRHSGLRDAGGHPLADASIPKGECHARLAPHPVDRLGRILLALMFVLAGVGKLMDPGGTAAYMTSGGLSGLPALAVLTGLVELLGGLAVATGFMARWAALVLALFTLAASFFFHRYWSLPADQQMVQQLMFLKNRAVAGGMLVLAALGPGPGRIGSQHPS